MKLSTVSMISAIAIFVATLPHGVGAWLIKTTHLEPVIVKLHSKEAVLASPRLYAQSIAKKKLNKMFGKDANRQWRALTKLWGKESAWNWKAKNPNSSAYGIAQVLGTPQGSTIEYQVNMGIKYIIHRYDTPSKAWAFWQRNGWY
jgi:hypothetical protein